MSIIQLTDKDFEEKVIKSTTPVLVDFTLIGAGRASWPRR